MSGSKDYPLVFKVMRLARPSLAEDNSLRINLIEDMGPDRIVHPSVHSSVLPASLMGADAARVQLPSAVDAMNITGLLQLPDSFGRIYLGENFSSYITLNNQWNQVASDIQVKVTLEQSKDDVKLLYDGQGGTLPSLAPGEHLDFHVKHDLKAVGQYMLTCHVNYTGGDGERRYDPQYFKFQALNPVSVRTKTRQAGRVTFLEASVENLNKSAPLLLDYIKLLPDEHLLVEQLSTSAVLPQPDPSQDPLAPYINSLQIVDPGGSMTFLYKVSHKEELRPAEVESDAVGRLEMMWRGAMGASGLLQTQRIRHHTPPFRPAQIQVVKTPERPLCGSLFRLDLRIRNNTDKASTGYTLHVPEDRPASAGTLSGDAPQSPGGQSAAVGGAGEANILLQGPAEVRLGQLDPWGTQDVDVSLVSLAPGLQQVPLVELRHPDLGLVDALNICLLVS